MIVKQELQTDEKGNVRLRNYCSAQHALDMARMSRELNESGRFGDKNGECRLLGYRALRHGDQGKHDYYMMKFFELFPAFAGNKKTKYWRGHRAVLI